MMYMFAHPGKKLQFMGSEFAQFDEWNNSKGIDFMLLEFEKHYNIFKFTKELNFTYLNYSELYEIDYSWDGFKWLTPNDRRNNVVAFERKNKSGEIMVCVCNFSPIGFEHYRVGVEEGRYICILATNEQRFGGTGKVTKFVTSERGRRELFGAGHNAFFTGKDGELYTSFHIQTNPDRPSGNRRTVIGRVRFVERDGLLCQEIE